MDKAVSIVDMPDNCDMCNLEHYDRYKDVKFCGSTGENLQDTSHTKPKWCPLVPVPHRLISSYNKKTDDKQKLVMDNVYADGWNDCLDQILTYNIVKDILTYQDTDDKRKESKDE